MTSDAILELQDAIFRERVARARRTPPEEKLWDGPRLFAGVCERMMAGIRSRHPSADDKEVHELLRQQLKRLDALGL